MLLLSLILGFYTFANLFKMIKQIPIEHLKEAFNIFIDVKKNMLQNGIDQWDDIYPNFNSIETDILKKQAFGYFKMEQFIGYIAINESFDKEYNALNWKYPDNKPLIVHRLAVNPKFQGMGIAKELMGFAEIKAKNEGYISIRLDAFSNNPKAIRFYHGLGYRFVGEVIFRKGIFHCFEKMIH
jgi:ribosomal protein S18 acetylase RimI-like enzyme